MQNEQREARPPTDSVEILQSLMRAVTAVLRTDDFATTARTVFDEACAMTGARSGYVALLNDQGDENEVLFLEAGGVACTVDPALPMPIRGLREQAYRNDECVWENDFMGSEWVGFLPAGHAPLFNVLFAPLTYDGKTHGIMGLANKADPFTEADAQLARTYGEFAAIALRNARARDKLETTVERLRRALEEARTLRGMLPICMHCKKIRDDRGYWNRIEQYISAHSEASFTHSLCPKCLEEHYPDE